MGGKHSKTQTFNPDFLIKIKDSKTEYIIVVEIKVDNDELEENKAKLKYAKLHFEDLNSELKKLKINQKYIFHFLSPNSYTEFFEYLKQGKLIKGEFKSDIEVKLEKEEN